MSEETRRRVADAMTSLVHPIPVNIRMFLNNFREHPAPLRNEDLWESDRDAIRANVAAEIAKTGKSEGSISYGGYGEQDADSPAGSVFGRAGKGPATILAESVTSPAFRMETTLGSAHYRQDPSGQIEINDAYDFNNQRDEMKYFTDFYGGPLGHVLNEYKMHGLFNALRTAGTIQRGDNEGTPFTFTIPPKSSTSRDGR